MRTQGQAASAQIPRELSRDEKWREDLKYLFAELPKRHKNLFFKITPVRFEREIAGIIELVPKLSDSEIKLALRRLTAMIGDPHTRIPYFKKNIYPILLYQFTDGVFVTAATEEYKNALGARLIKIGETDIERAIEDFRPIITVENEWWFKHQFPNYLTDPEILHLLKILPSADEGDFTFGDRNGKRFVLKLRPVSAEEEIKLIRPFDSPPGGTPLYLRNPGEYYWREYLADSKTLYINYRRCADMPAYPFYRFTAAILKLMDEHPVERVVIDLRLNGGGDSTIITPLIALLLKRRYDNQPGRLFALIGRGTFSSAYLNALKLKHETKAILVGEPTGQRPNSYGEVKTMTLPHSKLPVHYSTRYFKTMDGDPPTLAPDIQVERSSSDYASGRDPVLERVLSYKGK
ncbi:MAG TPA: S41 family peptidase [Blastocatellia bacterium]|nr:S41 family peptidase [Blastocatellia bacterium]